MARPLPPAPRKYLTPAVMPEGLLPPLMVRELTRLFVDFGTPPSSQRTTQAVFGPATGVTAGRLHASQIEPVHDPDSQRPEQ